MAGLGGTGKAKPSSGATGRATRFSEILKLNKTDALEEQVEIDSQVVGDSPGGDRQQVDDSSAIALPPQKVNSQGKVTKRGNPDYMQAIFHLPKKTSKRIDRELLDLEEEGETLDRSELMEEILQGFIRLSSKVGSVDALRQFRDLGK